MGETTYRIDNGYSIKAITDMDHFNTLRPVWNGLLESHTSHVPFLCFDWFRLWLKHFLKDNGLLILLLCKGDSTVAIAPFIIRRENFKGIMRARKVCLIGNVHSPIRNFIFGDLSNEARQKFSSQILLFFRKQFRQWDVMELDSIPEEDSGFDILKVAVAKTGLKSRQYSSFADWYLDVINSSGAEYIKRLPKKIRGELRRREKRLAELGNVRVEIGTNELTFDRHMDLYYKVRQKSWKSPENDRTFHCDIRKMAAKNGWLRCGFLLLDGTPIAAQIRIVSNRIVYFMEALHEAKYNKFGPGNILRSELIKYFIDIDHVTEIDQVRGGESYKKDWTSNERGRKGITMFNHNLKGQFLGFIMTTILPLFEKHPSILSAKNKLSDYMKQQ
jgi:CelD/BcsL family acetyltransferase involved in cellulose biosynthesis